VVVRVIGTQTGAMASIAEGCASIRVVRAKSQSELEAASRGLLAQPATETELLERRKALKQRFSWEAHVQRHIDSYLRVTQGKYGTFR